MTTLVRRPLITALVSLIATETGRPCGDGATPPGEGEDRFPYSIVYLLPGGGFGGAPLGNPVADATIPVQVSSVGRRRDQAELLMDWVREIVIGRTNGAYTHDLIDPAGQSVLQRRPDGGPGGVESSGRLPHRLFTGAERYFIDISNS